MTGSGPDPIVVGVDGSDESTRAVRWAAAEAALRHRPLRVVYAFVWPLYGLELGPPRVGPADGGLRNAADRLVAEALDQVAAAAPAAEAGGYVVSGTAAPTLLDESGHADLLVVGNRGLGGFTGLLVGSVSATVAAHAECPVVIVRPQHAEGASAGRVVVGIDGSPHSDRALEFAFQEAALRGAGLTVVHAWTAPVSTEPGDMRPLVYDPAIVGEDENRLIAEAVSGWQEKHPDVDVRRKVVHVRPARALVAESHGAVLTVVGSRGRGGFPGLRLGSVSRALVYHAGGPLAVVHGGTSSRLTR